jgi:hypothetical protein
MSFVKNFLIFVGYPLMAILGFTMFRYPETWAKMNASLSHKKFDSPKQIAHTRRVGILLMIAAAFGLVSMLYLNAFVQLK